MVDVGAGVGWFSGVSLVWMFVVADFLACVLFVMFVFRFVGWDCVVWVVSVVGWAWLPHVWGGFVHVVWYSELVVRFWCGLFWCYVFAVGWVFCGWVCLAFACGCVI